MTAATNAENFWQYKNRFWLVVDLMLSFDSSSKMVREIKN